MEQGCHYDRGGGQLRYIYRLRLLNCERIFRDGLPPGVIIEQEVEFDFADATHPMSLKAVLDEGRRFLDRYVTVDIIPIDNINGKHFTLR